MRFPVTRRPRSIRRGQIRFWAIVWVAAARMSLNVVGTKKTLALLGRGAAYTPQLRASSRVPPPEIESAVSSTPRFVPRASCLPQALGARALYAQAGVSSEIHIAASGKKQDFGAHAWVEVDGTPTVGEGPGRHTRLGKLG